jgi:hypothetical protein
MTYQLAEALKASGVVDRVAQESRLQKPAYQQIFRLSLTKAEIPASLTIQCNKWEEGLYAIRKHNLNSSEDAEALVLKLQDWSIEAPPMDGKGLLIYWRLYT